MCHAVFKVSFLQQEQTDLFLPDLCWNFWIFTEVLKFLAIYENLETVCVCGSLCVFPHTHIHTLTPLESLFCNYQYFWYLLGTMFFFLV